MLISIHAPLTGSDSYSRSKKMTDKISIHAPLTGSDNKSQNTRPKWPISIHAPLTGSDSALSEYRRVMLYFNPRSPYGERQQVRMFETSPDRFQSTLPLRGAT